MSSYKPTISIRAKGVKREKSYISLLFKQKKIDMKNNDRNIEEPPDLVAID